MTHHGEQRWGKACYAMTVFAAVVVRRRCELSRMDVKVTGCALRVRNAEDRVLPLGLMARLARDRPVAPVERISRCRMRFHIEAGRLEAGNAVTRRAVAAIDPRGELSAVRIFMTIGAAAVSQSRVEVPAPMARHTRHAGMFAFERKGGL